MYKLIKMLILKQILVKILIKRSLVFKQLKLREKKTSIIILKIKKL